MTDNITELFSSSDSEDKQETTPNFKYTISFLEPDETVNSITINGYIVVNSLYAAVCRGEGILYWLRPFESIVDIVNHGPVNETAGVLN